MQANMVSRTEFAREDRQMTAFVSKYRSSEVRRIVNGMLVGSTVLGATIP